MTTTRAAIIAGPGEPFTVAEIELEDPRPGEAVVRLVAAGLCHTDLGVAAGGLPFPLPGVLGHEGAGIVERVGGHFFGQSSFSHHALVDEPSMVKVDPDVPLEQIAPLGRGILTGTGAVWNVLRPRPGAAIVVLGAGAVGLSAVMAAALSPATTIIAVDRVAERLALARELGATHTINAGDTNITNAIIDATNGGADGIIETTGSTTVLRSGIDALVQRGTLAIVGAPPFGAEVPIDVNAMLPGCAIVGVTLGDNETRTAIPTLVSLVRVGRLPIDRLITYYPFEEIAQAARDVTTGTAIKPVLTFRPTPPEIRS